ncbi:MAG: acetylornithine deacetylase [Alphaproteobacteria bacterium]|nr:acetylornithine deacetylase [Alphaproteobacteria bacterium]MDE2012456.1 acetylornithine deacetylase [Alphaproteobacteria bacterium]MDE2072096.1 acetylornithine deacetylase [Alphaproteobacteria bacterium]MDE2352782.1 acetylornithine deacetylase [Alphaproteobacteria bacterium]
MSAALDMTKRLIGFDTTSRGSNLSLIAFAQEVLEEAGARCRLTYDDARAKANLFASFGPDEDGGIVLSGHSDVVPVDGQDWSSDPFMPEVRDGKLYGRGSADMKGFLGTALSLVNEIARIKLKTPLHVALSYDEELGCGGVGRLLADLGEAGIRPELAIIGEPTLMRVVGAHKAGAVLTTRCCGREGHSSAPDKGASAVMMAGEFVAHLAALGEELKSDRDPRFDPPYTTLQANRIAGGTAVNVLAREAVVTWEYRALPDRDTKALLKRIETHVVRDILPKYRQGAPDACFETTLDVAYPGLCFHEDSPALDLVREITGMNEVEAVSYGTEAGLFQNAGIPAVICGPGSIDQAHKADEFVALSELDACEKFLRQVIARAAA